MANLFVANSVAVFARVMERYFAPYAIAKSFIELIVVSTNGVGMQNNRLLTLSFPHGDAPYRTLLANRLVLAIS